MICPGRLLAGLSLLYWVPMCVWYWCYHVGLLATDPAPPPLAISLSFIATTAYACRLTFTK